MSTKQKIEKVTLKTPQNGSFSFRGESVKDGHVVEVTPSQKEWLKERGLLGAPAPKSSGES